MIRDRPSCGCKKPLGLSLLENGYERFFCEARCLQNLSSSFTESSGRFGSLYLRVIVFGNTVRIQHMWSLPGAHFRAGL